MQIDTFIHISRLTRNLAGSGDKRNISTVTWFTSQHLKGNGRSGAKIREVENT